MEEDTSVDVNGSDSRNSYFTYYVTRVVYKLIYLDNEKRKYLDGNEMENYRSSYKECQVCSKTK